MTKTTNADEHIESVIRSVLTGQYKHQGNLFRDFAMIIHGFVLGRFSKTTQEPSKATSFVFAIHTSIRLSDYTDFKTLKVCVTLPQRSVRLFATFYKKLKLKKQIFALKP